MLSGDITLALDLLEPKHRAGCGLHFSFLPILPVCIAECPQCGASNSETLPIMSLPKERVEELLQ